LRSVYLGTSEFAATVLRALAAGGRKPSLVVTPPDRRSGRGRSVHPPPTAVAAGELGIALHQTADVNSSESRDALLAGEPSAAVVCAFGQLIREPLLSDVEMLNVHPSLLPRWRGAAPIERAIMAGDERTGVCVMRLTAGLDSGPVALRSEVPIGPGDDYGSLAAALADDGGRLMTEALGMLEAGTLAFTEQSDDGVTYAEKIDPGERRVDPGGSAVAESRRVRALTPHIGAFVMLEGDVRLGVRDATPLDVGPAQGRFATGGTGDALLLGTAEGAVSIASVQPAGKRWMSAGDYLRGYGLPAPASGTA
jgi:methionyl-tRNA formyltransferase